MIAPGKVPRLFPEHFFLQKTCLAYFFFVLLQTDYIIMFNDEKDIYQS